jgi:hypothetical protein
MAETGRIGKFGGAKGGWADPRVRRPGFELRGRMRD